MVRSRVASAHGTTDPNELSAAPGPPILVTIPAARAFGGAAGGGGGTSSDSSGGTFEVSNWNSYYPEQGRRPRLRGDVAAASAAQARRGVDPSTRCRSLRISCPHQPKTYGSSECFVVSVHGRQRHKGTTTSSNAEDAKDAEDGHGEFTSRHGTSAVPVVRGVSFSALFAFSAINAVVVPSAVNGYRKLSRAFEFPVIP